jgi:hypothetical protein
MIGIGKILGAQFNLMRYLQEQNTESIKDSIVLFASVWPDVEACPVDRAILHRARLYLEERGWKFDVTQVERGLVLIAPDGKQYASHKNGLPKYTTL